MLSNQTIAEVNAIQTVAIIPAYNESEHIVGVIYEAKKYVDQVIVIDDGSYDNTAELADVAGALVVKHSSNAGKGAAINTAFEITRQIMPQEIVMLDGDGQHDPRQIPFLLNALRKQNADMVIGSRFLRKNPIPVYRRIGQVVLNITTAMVSGVKLSDSQSGFRAFSWRAVKNCSFNETGFAVESEMQFLVGINHLKVAEVPITVNYDVRSKRSPVTHGFTVLFRVIALFFMRGAFSGHK